MKSSNNRVSELFEKYLSGTANLAEQQEFQDYVDDPLYAGLIQQLLSDAFENQAELTDLNEACRNRVLGKILGAGHVVQLKPKKYRLWPAVAAAMVIFTLSIAGFFYYNYKIKADKASYRAKNDVKPGGNKAYLTLANGKRIELNDAKDGELAKQAGVVITKTASGQLIYTIEKSNKAAAANAYNLIETPKGGQYQIQLPDGTSVWLNAASVLKYPVSFAALKERRVELHGEAYFEVAKDQQHPFIVNTDKQDVRVLGTHFNISAYSDEPLAKTTLLEGSVKVNTDYILKPGEQFAISKAGKVGVSLVNVEDVIAWKKGYFEFHDENVYEIMRKVARWYDVQVIYEDEISLNKMEGTLSRFGNVSRILDVLESTGLLTFRIEGKKIYIRKP